MFFGSQGLYTSTPGEFIEGFPTNMLKLLLICMRAPIKSQYNHAQAFLLEFDELLQLCFQVLGAI